LQTTSGSRIGHRLDHITTNTRRNPSPGILNARRWGDNSDGPHHHHGIGQTLGTGTPWAITISNDHSLGRSQLASDIGDKIDRTACTRNADCV
jgi:hypothetical protein